MSAKVISKFDQIVASEEKFQLATYKKMAIAAERFETKRFARP